MNDHVCESGRKLSDYPISLRESARAVYGAAYAGEERRARARDAAPAEGDPAEDSVGDR